MSNSGLSYDLSSFIIFAREDELFNQETISAKKHCWFDLWPRRNLFDQVSNMSYLPLVWTLWLLGLEAGAEMKTANDRLQ